VSQNTDGGQPRNQTRHIQLGLDVSGCPNQTQSQTRPIKA